MVYSNILFFGLSIIAIFSALGMLFSKNAIYSALFLILNFSTIAIFYITLDAPFIAMTQVTVYAGAIMVLFLFVIMLLGAEQIGRVSISRWFRPVIFICGIVFFLEILYIVFTQLMNPSTSINIEKNFGSPGEIGLLLFDKYLLPFEITSVLLLTAMIGAIVLTRYKNRSK